MKRLLILCLIIVISIFSLTLVGCEELATDPIESFYDKYELSHVKSNYYKYGTYHSEIYTNPLKNLLLGSTEQNEFYNEVYDILGTYLIFEKKYITFGEKYPVEYSYSDISADGSFRFKFDNVFNNQTNTIIKSMYTGRTSVWLNYEDNTVKSRQIIISSELYVDGQGPLDFKPIATFEFVYSN